MTKPKTFARKLNDADLTTVSGGFTVGTCFLGYCASVKVDGLKVTGTVGAGESIGTQVYQAVMKGMHSVT